MNVVRFDLEIKKNFLAMMNFSIDEVLRKRLGSRSTSGNYEGMIQQVRDSWENLSLKNVKQIFNEGSLFAGNYVKSIQYFLFINGKQTNKGQLTLQVLLLSSENSDISGIVQTVIDDVYNVFDARDLDISVKPIIENKVYFYPFNEEDIYHYSLRLQGHFERDSDTKISIKKSAIVTILSVLLMPLFPNYETFYWEIVCTGLFFLITDIIVYYINRKPKIIISDLASAISGKVKLPIVDQKEADSLESPNV